MASETVAMGQLLWSGWFLSPLLLLIALPVVSGLLDAHSRATNVPEILEQLRMEANAAGQDQMIAMRTAAEQDVKASSAELSTQVYLAEKTLEQKLENINLAGESSLRTAKATLDSARRASADHARASAAMLAASIQNAAERKISGLTRRANQLEVEAQQRTSDATKAASSTHAAALTAKDWRSQWPREQIQ